MSTYLQTLDYLHHLLATHSGFHNPWTRFNADKDYLHLHWTTLSL